MKISAYTYIHNALNGGYPIREAVRAVRPFVDEVVIVDAESDDGTRAILDDLARHVHTRVVDAGWGTRGGDTLAELHALHSRFCEHDIVLHFEADETFDPFLVSTLLNEAQRGAIPPDARVWRIQVEQNFQKVRWWPHPVHRLFPNGTVVKVGESTDRDKNGQFVYTAPMEWGLLWDCTNCFRDCWEGRISNQSKLRGGEPLNRTAAPLHVNDTPGTGTGVDLIAFFNQPHWTWKESPLALPDMLKPLVGQVRYE